MWKRAGCIAGIVASSFVVGSADADTIAAIPHTTLFALPIVVPLGDAATFVMDTGCGATVAAPCDPPASEFPIDDTTFAHAIAPAVASDVSPGPWGNTLGEPAPVLLICGAFVVAMLVHRREHAGHGRLSLRVREVQTS